MRIAPTSVVSSAALDLQSSTGTAESVDVVTTSEGVETAPPATPLDSRIVITGSPRAGKSVLAAALGAALSVEPRHTDELVGKLAWGEDSIEVARWFDAPGPWCIEGVTTVRALRKWLAAHAGDNEKPCDLVVYRAEPLEVLSKGQESMRKGCATIWAGITGALEARGVEIRVEP